MRPCEAQLRFRRKRLDEDETSFPCLDPCPRVQPIVGLPGFVACSERTVVADGQAIHLMAEQTLTGERALEGACLIQRRS